jgi:hypothetical protein
MSDDKATLERLQRAPAPRDDELCRALAARIEPAWGFVVYGVLWMWLGLSLAFGLAAAFVLVGIRIAGDAHTHAAVGPAYAVFGVAAALVVWTFGRWVRGRRARARALFRDGQFVDGAIERVDHIWLRGSQITRVKIGAAVDGTRGHAIASAAGHLAAGGTVPILVLPGYRYCATFLGGVVCPAAWRS